MMGEAMSKIRDQLDRSNWVKMTWVDADDGEYIDIVLIDNRAKSNLREWYLTYTRSAGYRGYGFLRRARSDSDPLDHEAQLPKAMFAACSRALLKCLPHELDFDVIALIAAEC